MQEDEKWHQLNDGMSWRKWRDTVIVQHAAENPKHRCAGACPNHQIVSFDPLHLEPSLVMPCGKHGFIRDGRWIEA